MIKRPFYQVMLVTNKNNAPIDEYLQFIQRCAESGVTSVQCREKHLSDTELLSFGKALQEVLAPFNIPLLINDRLDIAIAINAAGVHLGQTDGDPSSARERLGPDKIIGVSIDSIANLHRSNLLPLDYVGIGSIFPTQNKSNVSTFWGTDGLNELTALSQHPVVAIGGIDERNAIEVINAGAAGIAAIGAFHDASDPAHVSNHFSQLIHHHSSKRFL